MGSPSTLINAIFVQKWLLEFIDSVCMENLITINSIFNIFFCAILSLYQLITTVVVVVCVNTILRQSIYVRVITLQTPGSTTRGNLAPLLWLRKISIVTRSNFRKWKLFSKRGYVPKPSRTV